MIHRSNTRPSTVDPAVRRIAFTLIVGALGAVFDTTIISVALNDLAKGLDVSLSTVQWVSTGYMLAVFITIPLAGWAQSRIGGRQLWVVALSGFLVESILSALAWNAASLIVFRILQGLAGGIMMPLMYTLIMQAAKGRNIGKVMAIITVPTAVGPILGPVLGGVILHFADWRWLFLINIPLCVAGVWLARRNLPNDRPALDHPRIRLDAVGALLLGPGSASLLYGLSQVDGNTGFASAEVLIPVLTGLALVAGFAGWSLMRASAPLLDVRLFRHRSVSSSATLLFLGGLSLFGSMMLLPLYFQQVRGATPLDAGLLLIPQGVGALIARGLAGKYMDQVGPRAVAFVAFIVVTASTVPFAFVTASTSEALLMAALFIRGVALGAAMIAPMGAAFVGLKHQEISDSSMITRIAQQIGGAVGVALLIVILQQNIGDAHTADALAAGYGHAFWSSVALTAAAVPLCLLLPSLPERPASADNVWPGGCPLLDRTQRGVAHGGRGPMAQSSLVCVRSCDDDRHAVAGVGWSLRLSAALGKRRDGAVVRRVRRLVGAGRVR